MAIFTDALGDTMSDALGETMTDALGNEIQPNILITDKIDISIDTPEYEIMSNI